MPRAAAIVILAALSPAAATAQPLDLEARVAELEAMAARKGNRKVSLEVSGLVNTAILSWDDGAEDNAYVVTNDNQRSRFRFIGSAKIDPEWEAGYRIELGLRAANSRVVDQFSDFGFGERHDFDIRDSVWYLKSEHLGTLFLGTTFAATDRAANSNLTQTAKFAQYAAPEDHGLAMFLRSSVNGQLTGNHPPVDLSKPSATACKAATGTTQSVCRRSQPPLPPGLTWRRITGAGGNQPGESERGFSLIKYATPTWNGFNAVGTVVAEDFWDAAVHYRGTLGDFDVAAAAGYLDLLRGSISRNVCAAALLPNSGDDPACRQMSSSFSVMHLPTGLFLNGGAVLTLDGLVATTPRYDDTGVDQSQLFWAGQAGIERQINALGKTTLYGELYRYGGGPATAQLITPADALNPTGFGDWAVWHADMNIWGGGLAQGIDDAAMIVYLSYRHVEGDLTLRQLNGPQASGQIAGAPIDGLDLLLTGAIIQF